MGDRGLARHRKRPKADRSPDEQLGDLMEDAINYLRDELATYTASAGNHTDVIRIVKALKELGVSAAREAVSPAEEMRNAFFRRLRGDVGVQDPEEKP